MSNSASFVGASNAATGASTAEKLVKNDQSSLTFLYYDQYINELASAASSAIESFLSIKPMFDLKPIEHNVNSNTTSYTHIFGFESLFESHEYVDSWGKWMADNWKTSIYYALVYVVLVFLGQFYMKNKPRYELRLPLIIWNIILAVFSLVGSIRVLPDFIYTLTNKGVVYSVCDNNYAYGITGFWAFMFIMSKLPELIDTLFIVLRKQELIFLHWYHHATVLIYCWYSYSNFTASGRWFMTMNYIVHAIMYSYYACKAMRLRVPGIVSKLITTGQILQMIAGCYVNYVAWQTKLHSPEAKCANSDDNIKYSFLMYLSYFALFFNFFVNAYILKRKAALRNKSQQQQQQQQKQLQTAKTDDLTASNKPVNVVDSVKHQNGELKNSKKIN